MEQQKSQITVVIKLCKTLSFIQILDMLKFILIFFNWIEHSLNLIMYL